jgi:hypothetical protein
MHVGFGVKDAPLLHRIYLSSNFSIALKGKKQRLIGRYALASV